MSAAAARTPDHVPVLVVDSRGRRCPLPILDLARRIGDVPIGAMPGSSEAAGSKGGAAVTAATCAGATFEMARRLALGRGVAAESSVLEA